MNKNKLKTTLDQLISNADAQIEAHESSRQLLYKTLAGVYLWWRQASQIKGFLEEIYIERALKTRGNEENFTRLIRLVWQIDWSGRKAPTLQLWSQALRKINEEFESNKAAYQKEPQERIRQYLDSTGGIRGALGIVRQFAPDQEQRTKAKSSRQTDELTDQAVRAKHLARGEKYFANQAKSLINITSATKLLPVNRKGYAVALLRQSTTSKYQILSITHDDQIVRETIIDTYQRNAESTPYALKLLGEIIETQSLPKALERHRGLLAGKSEVSAPDGKKMKQLKRLLIRAKHKDILLSESRNNCSVVTIALPNEKIISEKEDIFLRINDHRFIETEIIQQRNLSIFITLKRRIERLADKELKASHLLATKNTFTAKITNLYFYRIGVLAGPSRIQAELNKSVATVPLWRATVDSEWLESLDTVFLSNWLREYGSQINRPKHKLIQLCLGKKSVNVKYQGERGQYTAIENGIADPKIDKRSKLLNAHFLTKDIIPVLNALVHQNIQGHISLAANADFLSVSYSTALARYQIAVPTANVRGKRHLTAFSAYGA